ncbi:uncharacterized protein B0H18DRAFT_955926 [Fomitopsis serialis]|uniref:uncharacterized protein n=1 Tax=Fomitopsis serialis TaxID=139415 RepID=UPI002008A27C|nr:uncharacterized protein B0H18DRAFT_955926 [Neoantrodia serialis]KAH9923222.1 hypothetical protein B0H18DRAFT_955926 [Neoantrodia serialis]
MPPLRYPTSEIQYGTPFRLTTNRSNFSTSGILGLALASVSSIYFSIATDDGNALAANLFGMASSASVPSAPFSSRSLRHPGFDDVSSVLSVGVHPSNLVPDPSKVGFSDLVTNDNYDPSGQAKYLLPSGSRLRMTERVSEVVAIPPTTNPIPDVVLGVPFLPSVDVMSYEAPKESGTLSSDVTSTQAIEEFTQTRYSGGAPRTAWPSVIITAPRRLLPFKSWYSDAVQRGRILEAISPHFP